MSSHLNDVATTSSILHGYSSTFTIVPSVVFSPRVANNFRRKISKPRYCGGTLWTASPNTRECLDRRRSSSKGFCRERSAHCVRGIGKRRTVARENTLLSLCRLSACPSGHDCGDGGASKETDASRRPRTSRLALRCLWHGGFDCFPRARMNAHRILLQLAECQEWQVDLKWKLFFRCETMAPFAESVSSRPTRRWRFPFPIVLHEARLTVNSEK